MRHDGKTFTNERVQLDGNQFNGCKFVGQCTIVYSGGDLGGLVGCSFETTPKFELLGAAGNTLTLLQALYHGGFRHVVDDTFENIRSGVKRAVPPSN